MEFYFTSPKRRWAVFFLLFSSQYVTFCKEGGRAGVGEREDVLIYLFSFILREIKKKKFRTGGR